MRQLNRLPAPGTSHPVDERDKPGCRAVFLGSRQYSPLRAATPERRFRRIDNLVGGGMMRSPFASLRVLSMTTYSRPVLLLPVACCC